MAEQNLYKKVKSDICRQIFEGIYRDGDQIPPERKLSEELGISRVTVRKALELLEEERIISRIQGSGTRISMYYGAREGNTEIITLVASAQNEFFSKFLDAFQTEADRQDSLILYKQKPPKMSLGQCLYQIYEKGIHNAVLWPENMQLEEKTLKVLRGLGMNIVLFDTVNGGEYADAVSLDNQEALLELHKRLRADGCERIGYISWNETCINSLRVREETFKRLEPDGKIEQIPYAYHNHLNELPEQIIKKTLDFMRDCDGILYAVGELGVLFENHAKDNQIFHKAGMIGSMPGADELGIYVLEQDFEKMSQQIFRCFQQQNQSEHIWCASDYMIKGLKRF